MLTAGALPLGSTAGFCLPDPTSVCQQVSSPLDQHGSSSAAPGPSDMLQAAASVDQPPSNNLAGVTGLHACSLPPTPAGSAWTDLAGPTAAAAPAHGSGMCGSWGAAALPYGQALSSQLGEQLVGCVVETRSQLDDSWFTATVEVRLGRSPCLM
jgi:hypothetical protein